MVSKALNLVDLDFASQKADLIAFLKAQDIFKDYDFTGSNLNLQADLLAYNSNKHAFLTNMLMSEAFMDSAQLSSSIFSHAKDLNYLPRSARSAVANVTVNFTATGVSQPYIIPKGSSFATLIKNNSYVFSIPETISVSSPNGYYSFTTNIYEGVYVKDSYVYQTTEATPYPTFRITNKNIDTTSLTVTVYEDNSTIATSFQPASSLLGLTSLDKVFFIQASETGYYEIQFGDGIIGYTPNQNSLIVLDYRITQADAANGAKAFSINFDPTGVNELNQIIQPITINGVVDGGAQPESSDSVRYYAPRHFQTQERCIVPDDYEVLMKIAFPEINAVTAYGGEQLDPPRYGFIVVSADIGLDTLPISKENEYRAFLLKRMTMSMEPLFLDPGRSYVHVDTIIRYNINVTTNTPNYIQSLVATAISNYNIDNLNNFNVTLRYSRLTEDIDNADPSIVSNITNLMIYQKIIPVNGVSKTYTLNFNTPLKTGTNSTGFTIKGQHYFMQDDGNGDVQVYQYVNNKQVNVSTIGSIDYTKGIITLSSVLFDSYDGTHLKIYVTPSDPDIVASQQTILAIESDEVHITVQPIAG